MRVIARRILRAYVASLAGKKDQPAVKAALDAWFHEVRRANWSNAAEVKDLYARASIISADRVVFDIKGNSHRLITAIDFEKSIVWIKWIGTHKEYDAVDARKVTYDAKRS